MNGIENIKKRISEDAGKKAEAIISAANAEADKISDEYRKKAEAVAADIIAKGEKVAKENEARAEGSAELELKKKVLGKKQALITEAFEKAVDKLASLSDGERADVLAKLALLAANGGKGEIILSKGEKSAIGDMVIKKTAENKNITLSADTREIGFGFILRDGAYEVDCTFGSLVMQLRDSLSREVADILFG